MKKVALLLTAEHRKNLSAEDKPANDFPEKRQNTHTARTATTAMKNEEPNTNMSVNVNVSAMRFLSTHTRSPPTHSLFIIFLLVSLLLPLR